MYPLKCLRTICKENKNISECEMYPVFRKRRLEANTLNKNK